jgi:uncharacterized protein YbjT (DUF2867 family)
VSEISSSPFPGQRPIILCGGTGALGSRIAQQLLLRGAAVRMLVRKESNRDRIPEGATVMEVDFRDSAALEAACTGGACVVSALSGLRPVIVDLQSALLQAAIRAGVPRFIPSDYCIDYTKLPPGGNRNLDMRREFARVLDAAPVKATSILNGMFTDLLIGPAPVVLFSARCVVYWGNADVPLDFTTMDDTAAFTAAAALDQQAPRWLRIAGEVATTRRLLQSAEDVTGEKFILLRAGGLGALRLLTRVTRLLAPGRNEIFPAWQGMQYLHDMFTGLPKLQPLDNDRYSDINWTSVRDILNQKKRKKKSRATGHE